ncbi:MAG: hypothetical protein ACRDAQ_03610 [Cetobacterium sp.]
MNKYLIILLALNNLIIFKSIDSQKFKFNKSLLIQLCLLQFILIFISFIDMNKTLFIDIYNYFVIILS